MANKRILGIALSTRGFGYAVLEGGLIDCGKRRIYGDKNAGSLAGIRKVINRYQPDVLVLEDVNAGDTRRDKRIKRLHGKVIALAKQGRMKTAQISAAGLRIALLGGAKGTRHEVAEVLARRFPDELAAQLPPKRRDWQSEDARMDVFQAVGLAVVFRENCIKSLSTWLGHQP